MFVQVSSLYIRPFLFWGEEGVYQEGRPGGDLILGLVGVTGPCGTWREIVGRWGAAREEGDVRNVFAQEGRGLSCVNASLTISSSGRFIQRYRQVMWVYLT